VKNLNSIPQAHWGTRNRTVMQDFTPFGKVPERCLPLSEP